MTPNHALSMEAGAARRPVAALFRDDQVRGAGSMAAAATVSRRHGSPTERDDGAATPHDRPHADLLVDDRALRGGAQERVRLLTACHALRVGGELDLFVWRGS